MIRRGGLVAVTLVVSSTMVACGGFGDDAAPPSTVVPTTTAVATTTSPDAPTTSEEYSSIPTTPTTNAYPPPYIDHVTWVQTEVGASLQIYPTPNGRKTYDAAGADEAWREVLADAPDADTPGMRAQFDCHWNFARAVAPDKPSWNIEPSRPVVTDQVMFETRCNPGAPEE